MTFRWNISLAEVPLSLPALAFPSSRVRAGWSQASVVLALPLLHRVSLHLPFLACRILVSQQLQEALRGERLPIHCPPCQHLPSALRGSETTCKMLLVQKEAWTSDPWKEALPTPAPMAHSKKNYPALLTLVLRLRQPGAVGSVESEKRAEDGALENSRH